MKKKKPRENYDREEVSDSLRNKGQPLSMEERNGQVHRLGRRLLSGC